MADSSQMTNEQLREMVSLRRQVTAKRAAAGDTSIQPNMAKQALNGAETAGNDYLKVMTAPQEGLSALLAYGASKATGRPITGNTTSQVLDSINGPQKPILMPRGASWTPGGSPPPGMEMNGPGSKMALDMATDPMMYASGPLSEAAAAADGATWGGKAAKVANLAVNPIQGISDSMADREYGKTFFDLDRAAKLNDKPLMPSQIMRANNFVGTAKGAEQKLGELNNQAGQTLGNLRSQADARGVKASFWQDVAPRAMDEADQMWGLNVPEYNKVGDKIVENMNDTAALYPDNAHGEGGDIPFSELGAKKSAVQSRVARGGGFGQGYDAADATQVQNAMANSYLGAENDVLAKQAPELSGPFQNAKDLYSSTSPLISDKAESVASQVKNRRGPLEPTQIDMMLAGSGLASGDPGAIGALTAKTTGRLINSTPGRTAAGYTYDKINQAAQNGLLDEYLRQKLNPWGSTPADGSAQ